MISQGVIRAAYEKAVEEFTGSAEFESLIGGSAPAAFVLEFLRNVFRTHYLSSHIVALCYAALPSKAASLLKENLLEEMGHSEDEPPHSALLLKLAQELRMGQPEIDALIDDARGRVAVFSAARVPFATLREICLAVLIETLSFEFMLSRCSGKISTALRERYGIPATALGWFDLHSEVDVRHAEEALTVIQDYIDFHQIADVTFDLIQRATLSRVFNRHYFPPQERIFALPAAKPRVGRRIASITIYTLAVPFHQAFRHAAHSRQESDAIIVRVKDTDGWVGHGEALPRPYVTGETTVSMIAYLRERLAPYVFARDWVPGWETLDFLSEVYGSWTRSEQHGVAAWNAAFCAIELALIDWSLRRLTSSLAEFLPPARSQVTYSGVISSDSPAEAAALAARMIRFGLRQLKVKVGTAEDYERIAAVRQVVGPDAELRADANGVWTAPGAIAALRELAPFKLQVVEQPVAAGDLEGLKRVREEAGIPVMADESLVTLEDGRRLVEKRACDYFNIRLSKCGGIAGSLAIARIAREAGVGVQIGAQVGETGILSAAGRTLAAHLPELSFAEGSFGTWLLTEDITFEDVSFGYAGIAPLLRTRGLSVTVKDETLERLATDKIDLRP